MTAAWKVITSPLGGDDRIVMSVGVCLSTCISQKPRSNLHVFLVND